MRHTREGLFALVVLAALAWLASTDAAWFPQSWSGEFYVAKGLVGVGAVVLLLVHMSQVWPRIGTRAQRARYLLLLGFVTVVGAASTAQYDAAAPVTGRNLAGGLLALLTIPVALVSMRQDRRR